MGYNEVTQLTSIDQSIDRSVSPLPAETSSECSHKGFFAYFERGEVHLPIKKRTRTCYS